MPYLTYDEYIDLGFPEIGEAEFNKLLQKASDVIDSVTRSFYKFNDIDKDVEFRRNRFKKALAVQIQFFYDMGATTSYDIDTPASIQIGRTSISATGRSAGSANSNKKTDIICDDALMYLRDTGLLYAGIGVRR